MTEHSDKILTGDIESDYTALTDDGADNSKALDKDFEAEVAQGLNDGDAAAEGLVEGAEDVAYEEGDPVAAQFVNEVTDIADQSVSVSGTDATDDPCETDNSDDSPETLAEEEAELSAILGDL